MGSGLYDREIREGLFDGSGRQAAAIGAAGAVVAAAQMVGSGGVEANPVAEVGSTGPSVASASVQTGTASTATATSAASTTIAGTEATTSTTVAPGEPGADGLGDSFYPKMGNGGYDVTHYAIDLEIDPVTNDVDAVTTITATTTQRLSSFNLDFSGLTIDGVTVNDQTATYSRAGTELTITPGAPLADGSTFTVEVTYSGTPAPVRDSALSWNVGWIHVHNTTYPKGLIYVVSEPSGP